MAILNGNVPMPYGNADRGLYGQYIGTSEVAKEDFIRDIQKMQYQNNFNSLEAEKQRAFEKELANSSYQRAVRDMKLAGINPIFALGNGGASVPSGASASGSSAYSSQSQVGDWSAVFSGILNIAAGILTKVPNAKLSAENERARRILSQKRSKY